MSGRAPHVAPVGEQQAAQLAARALLHRHAVHASEIIQESCLPDTPLFRGIGRDHDRHASVVGDHTAGSVLVEGDGCSRIDCRPQQGCLLRGHRLGQGHDDESRAGDVGIKVFMRVLQVCCSLQMIREAHENAQRGGRTGCPNYVDNQGRFASNGQYDGYGR